MACKSFWVIWVADDALMITVFWNRRPYRPLSGMSRKIEAVSVERWLSASRFYEASRFSQVSIQLLVILTDI